MNLTLSLPRSRPAHLASIPAPEGVSANVLRLSSSAGVFLAERAPTEAVYHAMLPAIEGGRKVTFEVLEEQNPGKAPGIEAAQADDQVKVSLGGRDFMTFHHGKRYPKPVINPILTPGGTNMLREPMEPWTKGEHPWQRGLTLMMGAINGVDCWNERDAETFGRTEQDAMTLSHGPLSLTIATENAWFQGRKKLMTDRRSYRLFNTGHDAAVMDISLTVRASEGAVTFGDTKEAGFLCLRVNPTMNAAAGGTMRNAYGATDEKGCWSLPSHWMDYYGPVGAAGEAGRTEVAGFAIFDHPKNLRYPTTWHVRGYGLFAPNCWMFKPDHVLPAGEGLTFRWRVVVHTGDTERADIVARFLDYVDGPRAERS